MQIDQKTYYAIRDQASRPKRYFPKNDYKNGWADEVESAFLFPSVADAIYVMVQQGCKTSTVVRVKAGSVFDDGEVS